MSRAARIRNDVPEPAPAAEHLGPADVIEVRTKQLVLVELPDGARVEARLALAFLYEPAPGDVLLVIGRGGACYAIGVLHGAGKAVLAFQGDVDLRAIDGALHLSADKGIRLDGPELEVRAGKLRMIAGAVVQKFESVVQRVSALLSVHAGDSHLVVDETSFSQSKRAAMVTEETVTINGKQIHLG